MGQDKATTDAFKNPKAGMRFSEMYCFWVYVLSVTDDGDYSAISVREHNGHPSNPTIETIKYRTFNTLKSFRKAYAYGTIKGYWVSYIDNLAFERMAKETLVTARELEQGYRDEE